MPKKPRLDARDRKIVKAHVQGKTLSQIGKEVGLSKQRVHQLLPRLEPAIREALKRVDYDLDKALTKVIEMTEAEKTEEYFESYKGIITDERVVRKADNTTRMKARELMLRLNVGNLDNRNAEPGIRAQPPRITINLGFLGPEEAKAVLMRARTQVSGSDSGQPVLDADSNTNEGRPGPEKPL
jgi:hypothetical protein